MADDVTLNTMSGGSVVATDDSGTGHVQIVKLAYSADGSRTHLDADTDGLKVNVSNATVTVALGVPDRVPDWVGEPLAVGRGDLEAVPVPWLYVA